MSDPLRIVDTFDLPPDSGGTVKAFSRIGYDLTEALADLIDNSIDASAGRVEITFNRIDAAIASVTVADNGRGMTNTRLREAMRFAGSQTRPDDALGIYGLGMKSASLSQCQSVRHGDHTGLPRRVRAHDPFGYPASGREGYPRVFNAKLPDGGRLALNAHIWPYGSTLPEFLLGWRRGTPHQGIYFYRNDRLIQAGGWHGLVKEEAERPAFEGILAQLGYSPTHAAQYHARWRLSAPAVLVPVVDGAPRLTREAVDSLPSRFAPERVAEAQYRVDVEGLGFPDQSPDFLAIIPGAPGAPE